MSTIDSTRKVCTRCLTEKCRSDFPRDKNAKDGLYSYCKVCNRERAATWKAENLDRARARDAEYAANHREEARARARAWNAANKKRKREATARWEAANKELSAVSRAAWRAENLDKVRSYALKYYYANTASYRAQRAVRRAAEINAVVSWSDHEVIAEIYREASRRRAAGEDVHVDHIVPLRGKNVCGLHVSWNLQIIPAKDNLRKGARLHEVPLLLRPSAHIDGFNLPLPTA